METARLKTAMKTSISEVLETMFFLPLDFPEDAYFADLNPESDDNPLIASKLDFNGPVAGQMFFLIPWTLARSLAANFLGIGEEEVDRQGAQDIVKELLNMITGKAFSTYDDQLVIEIGIPESIDASTVLEQRQWESPSAISLVLDTVDAKLGLLAVIKD